LLFGIFRRGNKPPVLLGEEKMSRATIKSGEASAKPQRNIGKNQTSKYNGSGLATALPKYKEV